MILSLACLVLLTTVFGCCDEQTNEQPPQLLSDVFTQPITFVIRNISQVQPPRSRNGGSQRSRSHHNRRRPPVEPLDNHSPRAEGIFVEQSGLPQRLPPFPQRQLEQVVLSPRPNTQIHHQDSAISVAQPAVYRLEDLTRAQYQNFLRNVMPQAVASQSFDGSTPALSLNVQLPPDLVQLPEGAQPNTLVKISSGNTTFISNFYDQLKNLFTQTKNNLTTQVGAVKTAQFSNFIANLQNITGTKKNATFQTLQNTTTQRRNYLFNLINSLIQAGGLITQAKGQSNFGR